jgi:hypothetical protein
MTALHLPRPNDLQLPGHPVLFRMAGSAARSFGPGDDLRLLVSGTVVEDDVDDLPGRDGSLEGVEEADELLMPVALHATARHGPVEHVEGGEERGGAVALVVVGHAAGPAFLERQAGLGAVKCLDLRFLVDRGHDGMGRRVDVETDDVARLRYELEIVRRLEVANAVWREAMRLPDPLNRRYANADRLRHGGGGPMGRLVRWLDRGQGDDPVDGRLLEWRHPRRSGLVAQKAVDASSGEAFLPAPDADLRRPGSAHDLDRPEPLHRQKDDRGLPGTLLRSVAVGDDRLKPAAIFGACPRLARHRSNRNPYPASLVRFDPLGRRRRPN